MAEAVLVSGEPGAASRLNLAAKLLLLLQCSSLRAVRVRPLAAATLTAYTTSIPAVTKKSADTRYEDTEDSGLGPGGCAAQPTLL